MPFSRPVIFREYKSQTSECYFCLTELKGFSYKTKDKIAYPNVESASKPTSHMEDISSSVPAMEENIKETFLNKEIILLKSFSQSSVFTIQEDWPHLIVQSELNDFVRDLNLSKAQLELLGSIDYSNGNYFIQVKRKRDAESMDFFVEESELVYCFDVNGLMNKLEIDYSPDQWRFFIDASKYSLKAVLYCKVEMILPQYR